MLHFRKVNGYQNCGTFKERVIDANGDFRGKTLDDVFGNKEIVSFYSINNPMHTASSTWQGVCTKKYADEIGLKYDGSSIYHRLTFEEAKSINVKMINRSHNKSVEYFKKYR